MSVARVDAMTLANFLDWEARQETKYEFDGFEPVAMVGVTWEHSTIQANIIGVLHDRLRGKPCRPHGSELKVEVAGRIRYPDAIVVCNPAARGTNIITDPVVIFEILSDESSRRDRVTKNEEYRLTPSVQRYIILEQDEPAATVFAREGDRWVGTLFRAAGVLSMPEIGIEVRLAECYEGRTFAAEDQPAT
jgi:Uma2 family endonuclease